MKTSLIVMAKPHFLWFFCRIVTQQRGKYAATRARHLCGFDRDYIIARRLISIYTSITGLQLLKRCPPFCVAPTCKNSSSLTQHREGTSDTAISRMFSEFTFGERNCSTPHLTINSLTDTRAAARKRSEQETSPKQKLHKYWSKMLNVWSTFRYSRKQHWKDEVYINIFTSWGLDQEVRGRKKKKKFHMRSKLHFLIPKIYSYTT